MFCCISSGWMCSRSDYSGVQFFRNCLIYFIFSVTCIILRYPTFFYASKGPHFRSSRKSIIFEWKDSAKSTFFFKSSSISWITKQCFEISMVNSSCLISYYCSASAISFSLFFGNRSSGLSSSALASLSPSFFLMSRKASPQAMLTKDSLFI